MAISLNTVALCTFVTSLLFASAVAVRESVGESMHVNSLTNTTMADRLDEGTEFKQENEVDDPEAVAAIVDM